MTGGAPLADITARLERAGVPSPAVDAELLLAHVVGMSRGELLAKIHQRLWQQRIVQKLD